MIEGMSINSPAILQGLYPPARNQAGGFFLYDQTVTRHVESPANTLHLVRYANNAALWDRLST